VLTQKSERCETRNTGGTTTSDRAVKFYKYIHIYIFLWRCQPTRVMAYSFLRFLDHTQRRTTVGRTPLDEWPARRRDLYLTTHNTSQQKTTMPPAGFEPKISAGERPQTYALDRAATGTGKFYKNAPTNKVIKEESQMVCKQYWILLICSWFDRPYRPRPSHRWHSEVTLRHTPFGRSLPHDLPCRRREPCLKTHNTP
jgi:hypothetical protein